MVELQRNTDLELGNAPCPHLVWRTEAQITSKQLVAWSKLALQAVSDTFYNRAFRFELRKQGSSWVFTLRRLMSEWVTECGKTNQLGANNSLLLFLYLYFLRSSQGIP